MRGRSAGRAGRGGTPPDSWRPRSGQKRDAEPGCARSWKRQAVLEAGEGWRVEGHPGLPSQREKEPAKQPEKAPSRAGGKAQVADVAAQLSAAEAPCSEVPPCHQGGCVPAAPAVCDGRSFCPRPCPVSLGWGAGSHRARREKPSGGGPWVPRPLGHKQLTTRTEGRPAREGRGPDCRGRLGAQDKAAEGGEGRGRAGSLQGA